jgi:hypothetical protein
MIVWEVRRLMTIPSFANNYTVVCAGPEAPKAFGRASGSLVYVPVAGQPADTGRGAVGFGAGKCAGFPTTTNIRDKNPTCDIRYYKGGQWACHHKWSLLDASQEIPWADTPVRRHPLTLILDIDLRWGICPSFSSDLAVALAQLVFHHKYRFWVQPFTEGYHKAVHYGGGSQLLIGSPWEYGKSRPLTYSQDGFSPWCCRIVSTNRGWLGLSDVPKCAAGVAGCSFVDGTWIHTVTGSKYNDEKMVTLNFHCHAPTCLKMSVYVSRRSPIPPLRTWPPLTRRGWQACPNGTALENCTATSSEEAVAKGYRLICQEEPVYGGSGAPSVSDGGGRFDETGYIAIPDCLWGSAEQGLEAPVDLTKVPLFILKTANATWGHYGEMAGGQPFCV